MIDLRRYNELRGTKTFDIKSLKDAKSMAQDDGSPTFQIAYTKYDDYTGATSDITEPVNHFQVIQQRTMFVRERDRLNDQIQQIDNFLEDCAKALSTPAEVKA